MSSLIRAGTLSALINKNKLQLIEERTKQSNCLAFFVDDIVCRCYNEDINIEYRYSMRRCLYGKE